jgi:hypothetical protein
MCWNKVSRTFLAYMLAHCYPTSQIARLISKRDSLARAELYLTLATVLRRFEDQVLFESSRLDVDVKHDYLLPQQDAKSKGVRVLFK